MLHANLISNDIHLCINAADALRILSTESLHVVYRSDTFLPNSLTLFVYITSTADQQRLEEFGLGFVTQIDVP